MKTDALMAALAADAAAGPRLATRHALRLVPGLPIAGLVMLAALLLSLGLREGVWAVLGSPLLGKTLLPLAGGALALAAALRLAQPGARPLPRALPGVLAAVVGLTLLAALWQTPISGWVQAGITRNIPACLVTIPLLSLAPLAVILSALRQGACLDPARAGRMAGLAAGGMAATVYSLHCPEDNPLFFLVWYGLGVLMAGEIGRRIGARVLRW